MQLGLVTGAATSTVKHPGLDGWRLILVQPLLADGASPDGEPVLALDHLGARRGDVAVISSDGRHARVITKNDQTPARWTILGIVDP